MSTTLLSAFYDLDFLHQTEKSLSGLSLGGALDRRAVGAPLSPLAPGAGSPRRPPARSPPRPAAPAASTRYKTELCRPFAESGACKYGDKCQFAHGGHELRSLSRHPKYKTELCRTFHSSGLCPYGPRCHFIHNADERRAPPDPPRAPPDPPRAPGGRPDSPGPDPGRRLPIFSRLSVSDD